MTSTRVGYVQLQRLGALNVGGSGWGSRIAVGMKQGSGSGHVLNSLISSVKRERLSVTYVS